MALDMIDIGRAIHETAMEIRQYKNELYKHARAYAVAEKEYRLQLAKEIMKLRDAGMPVTVINDVARGNVSDLKFKRDLAEVVYTSSRDALRALQAQISGLQTLYNHQDEV